MATGKDPDSIELSTIQTSSSNMDQQVPQHTIVLFGSTSAVQFGDANILLGQMDHTLPNAEFFPVGPQQRTVSNRNVSVINILGLQEAEPNMDSVDKVIAGLFEQNGIHAFVFVLQLCRLTDADKVALEWLQKRFGECVVPFVTILFTYEREEQRDTVVDDLKNNHVLGQLVKTCRYRYCLCSKTMDNQSEMRTLLGKIDQMVLDNNKLCYTADMYRTACSVKVEQNIEQNACSVHQQQEKVEAKQESGMAEPNGKTPELATADDGPVQVQEVKQLFKTLGLPGDARQKFTIADIIQISLNALKLEEPSTEKDLPHAFLQKLLMVNYRARCVSTARKTVQRNSDDNSKSLLDFLQPSSLVFTNLSSERQVHNMDVQMAVFHCSDSFLKQLIVTKLSQCQYALPLLVPNPFTSEIEFPLWTFRQIKKSWKCTDQSGEIISKTKPICEAETPMVAFFRLGSVSSSKSQLINCLINEKHNTFFHRHCPGSSRNRLLMDGMVEIAWYCPSGETTDHFTDCVAFCNLHGDAVTNKEQLEILTKMSTVNVFFVSDQNETSKGELYKVYQSDKPLVCLLPNSDTGITGDQRQKYTIGLKNRNQSDVSKDLTEVIKECLLTQQFTFQLENMGKNSRIKIDENEEECQNGKAAALEILRLLKGTELLEIKETHLPCQGNLWHDWCQKNMELHRPHGTNIEMQKCGKQTEMKGIREKQHKKGLTKFLELFITTMNSFVEKDSDKTLNEKCYFLKFLSILLDRFTTDDLSVLHQEYDNKWSEILKLKKQKNSDQLKEAQTKLEVISDKLKASTIGIQHFLREMGQIYESYMFVQEARSDSKNNHISTFPKLATEIITSGYPLELMDGDAAHVPLIWVSAVLDELIKKLGDQRVFVLSVLGIQSSGKSTLLNAMFGLQFAVSAGRCTRGAFMQLVKVSEEMKTQLKFDYILVVDTEGLQSSEIPGVSTRHHDNGLATFVVGVGNMTLINIFGENPTDMQDILQIVVQAFMRMKRVRLNTSCMFVHQNVGDITARENTMEGRKRFLDNLDKMTEMAAKEEVCNAKCFSDVIAFDVRSDVCYMAQLWEGSPPMAPPNPRYCKNVHELKRAIISKITSNNSMKLSEFKGNLSNLWSALLHENFVFSFRNTLEIATYRRLEHEYSKWSWSLRGAMLVTENKLQNRLNNEKSLNIEETDIIVHMKETKTEVEKSVKELFDKDRDKDILIQWRERFEKKIVDLYNDLVQGVKQKMKEIAQQRIAREKVDRKKRKYENKIATLSKELAISLKKKETDQDALKNKFDDDWSMWVGELTENTPSVGDINVWDDIMQVWLESYEGDIVCERKRQESYKNIHVLGDYSDYIILNKQEELCQNVSQYTEGSVAVEMQNCDPSSQEWKTDALASEDNKALGTLIGDIAGDAKAEIQRKPIEDHGYSPSYISEIIAIIKNKVKEYESKTPIQYRFKKEFTVDLCLYVCSFAADYFSERYNKFKEDNDVRMYLEKQRPQYFSFFMNHYKGATSAVVLGEFIVDKLEPSILQAAYDQTAIDVTEKMKRDVPAFNGNRSNLEKHILTALAEEENFDNYILYIHKPRDHFCHFITSTVNDYIFKQNCQDVLQIIKDEVKSKGKCVTDAVKQATVEVSNRKEDVKIWLQQLSKNLKDELPFQGEVPLEQQNITNLEFLCEVVNKGITDLMSKLSNNLSVSDLKWEMFKKRPDHILIEHFTRCCWAQCPFCNATCTNTMEDHDGVHSVRFHRNCGTNGWSFVGTDNLGVEFCTTAVSSDALFFRTSGKVFKFKDYRNAGGEYARWNITLDNSEMPYWKWFVCRFKDQLEKHYRKCFTGKGQIPDEWRDCTKDKAIKSLNEL